MLRICQDCTAAYAVGIKRCPQCGSERAVDEGSDPYRGDNMPKINSQGEASFAADLDNEDGEQPSPTPEGPGTDSSTSSAKESTSPETSESGRPKRARKTANRSAPADATGDSTAPSAGGDRTAPTSKTDSDKD